MHIQGVASQTVKKCAEKQSDALSLAAMKLNLLPMEFSTNPELQCITDLNLSRNQLFNGEAVFQV